VSATELRPFLTRQEKDMAQTIAERLADLIVPELDLRFDDLRGSVARALEGVQSAKQDTARGWQALVNGAPPGLGQDAVYTVSGASLWPLSVMARLTTSSQAADRSLTLEYQDGDGGRFLVAGANVTQPASQTFSYCWQPGAGVGTWPVDDTVVATLPQQLLKHGCRLVLHLASGDPGDKIDQFRISGLCSTAEGE
jgi:hypothetical protein